MIYTYLDKYFKDITDLCIIEVGAHIGTDTVKLAKYTRDGKLICFEPDPRNIEELQALQKIVTFDLVEQAVGTEIDEIDFYQSFGHKPGVPREITDFSSTKFPIGVMSKHPWSSFKVMSVKSTTLDHYCMLHEISNIDLLWVDIQGGELDLVLGASMMLRTTRLFYFECMPDGTVLYKDQPTLTKIIDALPDWREWFMEFHTETDVLLRRIT